MQVRAGAKAPALCMSELGPPVGQTEPSNIGQTCVCGRPACEAVTESPRAGALLLASGGRHGTLPWLIQLTADLDERAALALTSRARCYETLSAVAATARGLRPNPHGAWVKGS